MSELALSSSMKNICPSLECGFIYLRAFIRVKNIIMNCYSSCVDLMLDQKRDALCFFVTFILSQLENHEQKHLLSHADFSLYIV